MSGLGIDMNPAKIGRLMRNPSGVAEMLTEEHPDTDDSPAQIFADIINVQRADTKRLAAEHGIDVEINLMSPERAAELLAGTISGDGVELVIVFNELSEKRDRVLREVLDDDEHEEFMAQKHSIMNTENEDEADDGGDGE